MDKDKHELKQKKEKEIIPCVENLFSLPIGHSETGHLIGSRCKKCEKVFFPKCFVCLNCLERGEMEEVPLSRKGKLYCYTIVHQKVPGSMIEAPFIPIIVELPEKIQVRSVLTEAHISEMNMDCIDREVEIVFEKIAENEEGKDLMTFKYRFI